MTLEQAQQAAQRKANETGSSVLVYRATHQPDKPEQYGVAFTLPTFGERIGERIYPDGTQFVTITDTMTYFPGR